MDDGLEEERRLPSGRDRDRISALATHFTAVARQQHAEAVRLQRVHRANRRAIVILYVALCWALLAYGYGYAALQRQATASHRLATRTKALTVEQTRMRYRTVYTACLERDKTNDGIVAYLRKLGASRRDVRRARRYFPDQVSCRRYTVTLLGSPAPAGAFDLPMVLQARTRRP